MESDPPSKKVFISYTHDSTLHSARVLKLANDLRKEGFDVDIDQYHANQNWPAWMEERLRWATKVLVICTENYLKRWEGREAPQIGLGAQWESLLARQELYEAAGSNRKYIPCCFSDEDLAFIPAPLRPYTRVILRNSDLRSIKNCIDDIPPAFKPLIRPSLSPITAAQGFFSKDSDFLADEELGLTLNPEDLFSNLLPLDFPPHIHTARLPAKRIARSDFEASVRRNLTDEFHPTYFIDGTILYTFDSFSHPFWKKVLADRVITPDLTLPTQKLASGTSPSEKGKFIKILNRSLEEICRSHDMAWSRDMRCYYFPAARNTTIRHVAAMALKNSGKRRIYRSIPSKSDPTQIQHWQHQAFRHKFHQFAGKWFLCITPFWAFTSDGLGKPSRWQKKSSANMRKPERNRAVLGHVVFWASILSKDQGLFNRPSSMRIRNCISATSPVGIEDDAWANFVTDDEREFPTDADSKDEFTLS